MQHFIHERIEIIMYFQTNCQLSKFMIRDIPFKTKFTLFVKTRGTLDSASLENHHNNGPNSWSHSWPKTLLGRCMSKFRQMANTRGRFMLYIRLLYIHMLLNAYKRDCLGLLWQTISMYRMCYICVCLYIHCVRHVHHCLKVKRILTMATGGISIQWIDLKFCTSIRKRFLYGQM